MGFEELTWEQYREALRGVRLPAALVNMNAFEKNIEQIASMVRREKKTLRVASKSLRCPGLMKRIFQGAPDVMKGVMAFTCEEAEFLSGQGFDDFLIAYPTVQKSDMDCLIRMTRKGKTVAVAADCREHIDALAAAARDARVTLRACLDVDASLRIGLGKIHIGVRRSPLRDERGAVDLARYARAAGGVRIAGMMMYEAHIAGVPDKSPFAGAMNAAVRIVKAASKPEVARRRKRIVEALAAEGVALDFVNGGGTGSLDWTPRDPAVTEAAAGSGFFCPHLFSYFQGVHLLPAAFFALQVVRESDPGFVTCHGGGYVASGQAGQDKLPVPFLPKGLALVDLEGAGEVQTPLALGKDAPRIRPGDPILFRHAKSGELSERFNEYVLIRDGAVIEREPTYRGLGKCFL